MTTPKKRDYTKKQIVQTRVTTEDLREILAKAALYSQGNVSDFIRMAALNYRPIKRVPSK